jgi:hypothetical protein
MNRPSGPPPIASSDKKGEFSMLATLKDARRRTGFADPIF